MPPGWAARVDYGVVTEMSGVPSGLVSAGQVNVQPAPIRSSSLDNAATWSTIWFVVATVYLLGIYFGMINIRGRA